MKRYPVKISDIDNKKNRYYFEFTEGRHIGDTVCFPESNDECARVVYTRTSYHPSECAVSRK